MRLRVTSALLFVLFTSVAFAQLPAAGPKPQVKAPQVEQPRRVLFVGNRYFYDNDSLHNHGQRMVVAADKSLEGVFLI